MPLRRILALFVFAGCFVALEAVGSPGTSGADLDPDLVTALLDASGVEDPTVRDVYRETLSGILANVRKKVGDGRPTYRRARRLHHHLHDRYLLAYRDDADGIDAILDEGAFNCVSGSLFFGLLARALGYDVHIAEGTRHLLPALRIEGEEILVEITSPAGFDLLRDLRRPRWVAPYASATPAGLQQPTLQGVYGAYSVALEGASLEAGVAYLWHNRGQRALARGEPLLAAERFLTEHRLHPDLARRSDALAGALARAFRQEYDDGRFDSAYRIAEIDLTIYPGRTTGRDRLMAAALKRVLAACEAGDLAAAEEILAALRRAGLPRHDLDRLLREACPEIVAGAVRAGDWERAMRMADRYARAEPDPVEGARLRSWVEQRQAGRPDAPPRALPGG